MDRSATGNAQGRHVLFLAIGLGIISVMSCFALAAVQMPAEPAALSSTTDDIEAVTARSQP